MISILCSEYFFCTKSLIEAIMTYCKSQCLSEVSLLLLDINKKYKIKLSKSEIVKTEIFL